MPDLQRALTINRDGYFDGTHRVVPPAVTWARAAAALPIVGVTRVADVTHLDRIGIPVFQAIRPMSRNLSVHQGKGASRMAARVSAVMEAIELWHAESLSGLPTVSLSIREMSYDNAVHSDQLRWLPDAPRLHAAPLEWVRAVEVGGAITAWLPAQMLRLDFSLATTTEPTMFHKTSNGLASGNTHEEALVHAICELVERHALFLRSEEAGRGRAVDPATVDSPACRYLIKRIMCAGMKLSIIDVTWHIGIPVFLVELVADDLPVICYGSGCHLSREIALSRALTEAAQSRLTYIAGSRDDIIAPGHYESGWSGYQAYIPHRSSLKFGSIPDIEAKTVADSLAIIVDRLSQHGYRAFQVDLTRRNVGIPVVIVYIPGLRDDPHK